jgi:hypothetical protein
MASEDFPAPSEGFVLTHCIVAADVARSRVVPAGEDPAQSVVVPGCGSGRRVGGWPMTCPACAWRLPVIQQVWS